MTGYLIEVEDHRPEDEDPPVAVPRPPRPEHRRVYASLVLTTAILVGTVIAVYALFPARHHVLATTATDRHRAPAAAWELPAPTAGELHAWLLGVLRAEPPLPPDLPTRAVIGAEAAEVLSRPAAVVRLHVGTAEVTYVIARARGVSPASSRTDGDLQIFEWRRGPWALVAVGPAATAASWKPLLGVP